jgi:pectate lyase
MIGVIKKLGWAGMYNSGQGVTGGKGGAVFEFTNWDSLWDALVASNNTAVQIYRYTGASNVSLIDKSYFVSGKKNKTIECSNGQILERGELRFQDCENIIIRNINRRGPYTSLTSRGGSARDYFTIRRCIGVILDHCEGDGEDVFNEEFGVDGWADMGTASDYLTFSNNKVWGSNRGHLLGNTPAQAGSDLEGYLNGMRYTFAYNWYQNVINRAPQARWGKLHLLNNFHDWVNPPWRDENGNRIEVEGRGSIAYVITLRYYCQIYSQGNFYNNGGRLLTDQAVESGDELLDSGAISDGDYVTPNGYQSTSTANPPRHYNNVNVRTSNVLWNPNTLSGYEFDLMTPENARDYVIANAGANLTLASYNLNVSKIGFGAINLNGDSTWTNLDLIHLQASPESGYTVQWRLGSSSGEILSTSNNFDYVMPSANTTIVAVFVGSGGGDPEPPSNGKKFIARKRNNQ